MRFLKLGGAALALLAAMATICSAQEADWAARPGEEVSESYPPLALAMRLTGKALLVCTIDDAGVVVVCKATSESPHGLGFGAAAEAMSAGFRFKPGVGEKAGDHEVRFPIKFALPLSQRPMPAIGPPTSPDALPLARQYLELEGASADWTKGRTDDFMKLSTQAMPGVDQATRTAGLTAVLAAGEAAQPRGLEVLAQFYAAHLSADQLRAAIAYDQSEGGQILRANRWSLDEQISTIVRLAPWILRAAARQDFCSHWNCEIPAVDSGIPKTPEWVEHPSNLQLFFAQPALSRGLAVAGRADVHCTASPTGLLGNCQVGREFPAEMGFGIAALRVSKLYRALPSPDPHELDFAVSFGSQPGPARTLGTSKDHAVATAQQIVLMERVVDHVLAAARVDVAALEQGSGDGMSPRVQAIARNAHRAAALSFAQYLVAARALAYAKVLPLPLLEARLAYVQSPEYQAIVAMQVEQNATFAAIADATYDQAASVASEAFCSTHSCADFTKDEPPKP